jgi:hypothetical protein
MSATPTESVLARVEGARRNGANRWMAKCPAHADGRPSLAIRETEDGAVLLHCFAGCGTAAVVTALGLEFEDLFPPRQEGVHAHPREKRPFRVADAIEALAAELGMVWVLLGDLAAGKEISGGDRRRAGVARERCQALMEALRHVR